MYQVDMKAFKSAMKLIVESQIAQPVEFKINKNTSEFVAKNDMWRLVVPVDCVSDIENTIIKLTNETFNAIYKGLRAVKKELSVSLSEDKKTLHFFNKEEMVLEVPVESVLIREQRTFSNETLATLNIDDMLSFLNSVFAFRSNKFTPIDANVEIRFDHDTIRFLHFTSIKMSRLNLKNITQKEYRTITIPTKQMNIAYSLFKNSLEFEGEIQENDNVLIFSTKRFKLGLKKEHKDTKPLEHLFNLKAQHGFTFNNELTNRLYAIKKELTPLLNIQIGDELLELTDAKIKPLKDDLMVQILKTESGIKLCPYLYKSVPDIGDTADGCLAFYDLSAFFEVTQSFIEPGFQIQVLENQTLRVFSKNKAVEVYLLPIIPYKRNLLKEDE